MGKVRDKSMPVTSMRFNPTPLASIPNACLTYADGMLYLYTDDGSMALAKPGDTTLELAGTLKIDEPGRRQTWAHPVVLDGRLYLRHGDGISVYDVADHDSSGDDTEG